MPPCFRDYPRSMASGAIAAFIAVLALGFVEGFRRFYPSRRTWMRLRSLNGRRAVIAMRERFEATAQRRTARALAGLLLALVAAWVAAASLLDKRWYEVVMDAFPYALVSVALLRTPGALRAVAARMKEYERDFDDDREADPSDGGPAAVAL